MKETSLQWNSLEKILFRFAFIVFTLFFILVNNGTFRLIMLVTKYLDKALQTFLPWFAKNYLQLGYEVTSFTGGSGDTTYDYLILLLIVMIAIPGTIVWSIIDRKRFDYRSLYYWLTVAARYYVGFMLIHYGLVKVIKLQFPAPGPYRLNELYGDSSPMGLAWTFLGFSTGYNLFMGIAEMLAGFLLFRRTVVIGALFTLMASANIMAVNYFYDVPVKIVSTALVLLSIFLLLPNINRLFRLFIKGEAVCLRTIDPPHFKRRWLLNAIVITKYIVIALAIIPSAIQIFMTRKEYGDAAPKSPLYGTYTVDTYVLNKDTIAPDMRQIKRWKALNFTGINSGTIRLMNDSLQTADVTIDTIHKKITIDLPDEPLKNNYLLHYALSKKGELTLIGKMAKDSIHVEMKKKKFLLMNRGFHWINEHPLNR